MFTSDAALINTGTKMLRLMSIGLPVAAIQMNGMSYMSATGKAMRTLGVSLGRQLFSMALMLVMQHFMGETGLMLAYPLTDIVATVPSVMLCIGEIKKMFTASRNSAKPANA
jgi:Na+-driven multidrug efflux pump